MLIMLPQLTAAFGILGGVITTAVIPPIIALVGIVALAVAGLALLGFGIYKLIKHHTDWNRIIEQSERRNEALARSNGKITEEVVKETKAYNELRREYGQLTEEEEAALDRSDAIIKGIEDGTYAYNELTGALELTAEARANTVEALMAEADAQHALVAEVQAEIDKRKELMGILGKLYPGGLSEKEWNELMRTGFFDTLGGSTATSRATGASGLGLQTGIPTANITIELDGETIARKVEAPIVGDIRLSTGVHS